ncbi:MAG: nucleotidyl transferase AbiEii/AbiGii toxin family protein [Thermoanaerobaculia bacterium]
MSRLQTILEKMAADLDMLGARWCLVGGLAVSVWGEPRLTRDVDVAVAVEDDRQAEELIRELRGRGYQDQEIIEQEAVGRLATARLHSLAVPNGIVVDILFASAGIEQEAVRDAIRVEVFEGLEVPVAPRPHLIVMKLLARHDRDRPMDADDLRSMLRNATDEEIGQSRALARLVEDRGYARGRSLVQLLDEAIVRMHR